MKTKLFLIATLFISTITFSQTTKKGYDYYKASSAAKMNKGELVDAIAKDANSSRKKIARTGRNPQVGSTIKSKERHNWVSSHSRGRISKQEFGQTKPQNNRIRPIDGKREHGRTRANYIRKRPGITKATDYNSSRSNKRG